MRALVIACVIALGACSGVAPAPVERSTATQAAPTTAPPVVTVPSDPDRYGVIVGTRDGFAIRAEGSPTRIRTIEPTSHRYGDAIAVSRTGRYVAYWRPAGDGDELMVYDAVTNAEPAPLLARPGEYGGALVWADDTSGLAFATASRARESAMTLWSVDIVAGRAAGAARKLAATAASATQLHPVAWVRATHAVSAVEGTIEGVATAYLIVPEVGSGAKRFALSSGDEVVRLDSVRADDQSRRLAFIVTFTCQDGDRGCTLLRFWDLENPQLAEGLQALWHRTFLRVEPRPFTRDVALLVRDAFGAEAVEFWAGGVYGELPQVPALVTGSQILVRPDGSGVFVAGLRDGGWHGAFRDLVSGGNAAVDLTTAGGGSPARSIVIGPDQAAALEARRPISAEFSSDEILANAKASLGASADRIVVTPTTVSLRGGHNEVLDPVDAWTVAARGAFPIDRRGADLYVASCVLRTYVSRTGRIVELRAGGDDVCDPYLPR